MRSFSIEVYYELFLYNNVNLIMLKEWQQNPYLLEIRKYLWKEWCDVWDLLSRGSKTGWMFKLMGQWKFILLSFYFYAWHFPWWKVFRSYKGKERDHLGLTFLLTTPLLPAKFSISLRRSFIRYLYFNTLIY